MTNSRFGGATGNAGGVTATALVAASRMGARCAYVGTLGHDELSEYALQRLTAEQLDLCYVQRRNGARPIHATIVVDETERTRTVFHDLAGTFPATPDWPPDDAIRSSRVLVVDHFGVEGMIRAARVARAAGIPVVADFECPSGGEFAELVALVDHLILSHEFARRWTGQDDPSAAAMALWAPLRQVVVITWGAKGCWYAGADAPNQVSHQPAFPVQVVDTTGCGDVFHGVYAAGLAQGLPLPDRVRRAAAAAALEATCPGGQRGIPGREAVDSFLQQR